MSLVHKKLQNPVIFKLKFCSFLVSSLYLPLFCENVIHVDFTWFLRFSADCRLHDNDFSPHFYRLAL